jgi:hypothetical protein
VDKPIRPMPQSATHTAATGPSMNVREAVIPIVAPSPSMMAPTPHMRGDTTWSLVQGSSLPQEMATVPGTMVMTHTVTSAHHPKRSIANPSPKTFVVRLVPPLMQRDTSVASSASRRCCGGQSVRRCVARSGSPSHSSVRGPPHRRHQRRLVIRTRRPPARSPCRSTRAARSPRPAAPGREPRRSRAWPATATARAGRRSSRPCHPGRGRA